MKTSDSLSYKKKLTKYFAGLVDLIYPHLCFNCKQKLTRNSFLCQKCENKITLKEKNHCEICHKEISSCGICSECKNKFPFEEFLSVFDFNQVIQNMIHNFKYNENRKIGNYLSNFLSQKLENFEHISSIDYSIPVPLHKVKKRDRGFNQAYVIAQNIQDTLQIPVADDLVKRKRFTKTQTNLSKSERHENVADAFVAEKKEKIMNKNFLLIDDVFTTGSTLSSLTYELKNKGANKVFCATLARA